MFSLMLWYILICLLLMFVIKYHWDRRKLYSLANKLHGPRAFPIIGNALAFFCKEDELFERMSNIINTYPSPLRFWLGPKLVISVKTATEMEKILTSPKFNDKDDIYRFLKVFNGVSLFTTNGTEWKKQRKYITPYLGHKYIHGYSDVISDCATLLVNKLQHHVDKPSFDINYYLGRCYNDIVTEVLMGFKPGAQNGHIDDLIHIIHRMYVLLHSRMLKTWLHPDFIFHLSSNGKEQLKGRGLFRKFVNKGIALIESKKNNNFEEPATGNCVSILEQLMIMKHDNPELYSDQNLLDHISTLYSAAEDTVNSICSYLLLLLGMYPNAQERIVEEIQNVIGNFEENVTYKDITEFKYLDMCVKEILRLFPIGPYILRKVKEDFQLGDITLPKDCTIVLSFYSVHRDPEYWEKPNEFYPEHFLSDAVAKRPPFAFLPFSSGARSCPGQLLAYVAIKTVAVAVLQRYVIEADGNLASLKIKADISIRPVDGYYLRIKRRTYDRNKQ